MYLRFIFILLIFCMLLCDECPSQIRQNVNFAPPLDIPLSISGNFGELRANHIHSGVDFRTLSMTGLNVFATEEGYVSRIKIEPAGFGRAIYITHPNGYVSVYGHLEALSENIDRYCKNEQYKRQQFAVDLMLNPHEIDVKKGDFIAYSGNAGASGGPHLHFEIREDSSQFPCNVLRLFNITIHDTIPPKVEKLWIYPLNVESHVNGKINAESYLAISVLGRTSLHSNPGIMARGEIGLGIQAFDVNNDNSMRNGIYSIEVFDGDVKIFEQVLDKFSFYETRYVNSLIDYKNFMQKGVRINRLFLEPNNKLSICRNVINRGILKIDENTIHNICIRLKDDNLNVTELKFSIKGGGAPDRTSRSITKKVESQKMYYNRDNLFQRPDIKVEIPENALFDNLDFEFSKLPKQKGFYSSTFMVHNSFVPLYKSITVSIKPINLPERLFKKALLVSVNERGGITWCGGGYSNGVVKASVRSFGKFAIKVDTTPPTIKPYLTHINDTVHFELGQIAFKITDNLSGIQSYNGYIDGQWVLFEYDAKSDMISYQFDPGRFKFGLQHKLDLYVIDAKENKREYHTTFFK